MGPDSHKAVGAVGAVGVVEAVVPAPVQGEAVDPVETVLLVLENHYMSDKKVVK